MANSLKMECVIRINNTGRSECNSLREGSVALECVSSRTFLSMSIWTYWNARFNESSSTRTM